MGWLNPIVNDPIQQDGFAAIALDWQQVWLNALTSGSMTAPVLSNKNLDISLRKRT
jgi:hypothetical protein